MLPKDEFRRIVHYERSQELLGPHVSLVEYCTAFSTTVRCHRSVLVWSGVNHRYGSSYSLLLLSSWIRRVGKMASVPPWGF